MGQYKLQIKVALQMAIGIKLKPKVSFEIELLCFTFYFGLDKSANGFDFYVG